MIIREDNVLLTEIEIKLKYFTILRGWDFTLLVIVGKLLVTQDVLWKLW